MSYQLPINKKKKYPIEKEQFISIQGQKAREKKLKMLKSKKYKEKLDREVKFLNLRNSSRFARRFQKNLISSFNTLNKSSGGVEFTKRELKGQRTKSVGFNSYNNRSIGSSNLSSIIKNPFKKAVKPCESFSRSSVLLDGFNFEIVNSFDGIESQKDFIDNFKNDKSLFFKKKRHSNLNISTLSQDTGIKNIFLLSR